ncbi:helix-turn-helix domain-containing protein [Chloroflexota bacterium]
MSFSDNATLGQTIDVIEDKDNEPDLPPEYHHYRDEGCEAATAHLGNQSSCLNCPFPGCIYDQYGGRKRWLKRQRAREMLKLFTSEGKGVKELAAAFGVSQRTVQRALKRAKK